MGDELTSESFLGIEASVTGRRWLGPGGASERAGLAISQETGLPEVVARLLAVNGVSSGEAESYLAPRLRELMPDPSCLADMDAASDRLTHAVVRRERIAIFGDYDVDGAASVALLVSWLRDLGLAATIYIPDRIDEGYGPNEPAMRELGATHDLVVCVDCGTLSHQPVAAARTAGADVLIVDHHLPSEDLPDAFVVNPNRRECGSGLGHLCAAGVVFMLLVAANRQLRARDQFTRMQEPDLMGLLDLVAVATVADVTPMIGLNRAFVRQGLAVLAQRARPGLVALADVARLTAPPTARDLGFALGPRINAGGRIGAADMGARLLSTTDPNEASALAQRLDALNTERRAIEAAVLDASLTQAQTRGVDGGLVWAAGEGWHPGVVGIVAARLKERFGRPAVVIGLADGKGKGSGRSITGIDLGSEVQRLATDGVLLKGGGHRMAAGLTLEADRLDEAMEKLNIALTGQGAGEMGPEDLKVLGALSPGGASIDLIGALEAAGPFGPANPAPRLAFPDVIPTGVRIVGNGHLQVRFSGAGGQIPAIAFGAAETPLGAAIADAASTRQPMHVAGRLELDDWGGRRKAKLRLEDAAAPT
ncbi:MAG: single-stranded-DNA-specific exonuclease RecJ [Pseudomonadota bacterium]